MSNSIFRLVIFSLSAFSDMNEYNQKTSTHLPALERLCRNWQNYVYCYICHSGLDPESSAFSVCYTTGYPRIAMRDRLLKSGMTDEKINTFWNYDTASDGRRTRGG